MRMVAREVGGDEKRSEDRDAAVGQSDVKGEEAKRMKRRGMKSERGHGCERGEELRREGTSQRDGPMWRRDARLRDGADSRAASLPLSGRAFPGPGPDRRPTDSGWDRPSDQGRSLTDRHYDPTTTRT
jgi:hypothetical protein